MARQMIIRAVALVVATASWAAPGITEAQLLTLDLDVEREAIPPSGEAAAESGTRKKRRLYLAPSIGTELFVLDLESRNLEVSVVPGAGYGIRWNPSWWEEAIGTAAFLSFDVTARVSLVNDDDTDDSFDHLFLDAVGVLTIGDIISVGVGPRVALAVFDQEGGDDVRWVFVVGVRTSTTGSEDVEAAGD